MPSLLEPTIAPASAAVAPTPSLATTESSARAKVLIVDDDYGPRESLRILLKYDYDVLVAGSVAEGVDLVNKHRIDTIIMDNRMPGRTGLDGISDIRQCDESVSIIMLTGYGTLETACEAFRKQATDFMTKPPDTDALMDAVAKNVSLSRAKRTRASVSKELADLNMSLTAELSETRPLAKLGQRSDEIIHDLGNPLTILTCCIELLQTKINEMRPEAGGQWIEALGYIQMIKRSVQHCCSLADTWRQLRDDISQDRSATSAREFLVEAVDSMQPMATMAEATLKLQAESVDPIVRVDIDASQMRRVVHNLLINAMQATEASKGTVLVKARATANDLEFSVADNGSGIPADRLAVIFEPYYSTKTNGTGLGLAIAKRIVEEHGGTLRAESEVGRGSTFIVKLPLKAATASAAA